MMNRGFVDKLLPIFVMAIFTIILIFQVAQPQLNTALAGNGTCAGGGTCAWNQSGYPTAQGVAMTLPIFYAVLAFGVVAALVMMALKLLG